MGYDEMGWDGMVVALVVPVARSEERGVGEEGATEGRSRWSPDHEKKKGGGGGGGRGVSVRGGKGRVVMTAVWGDGTKRCVVGEGQLGDSQ